MIINKVYPCLPFASLTFSYLSSNRLNAIRCGEIVYQGAEECPDTSPVTTADPTPVLTNGTVPADNSGSTSQNTTPEVSPAERTADESNDKKGNYTITILSPIFGVSIAVIIFFTLAFYFKKIKKPKAETDREEGTMQNLV